MTGIVGEIINSFGVKNFQPWLPHIGTVLSQNNTVEPVQATLRDIKQAPQTYINRLVHVSHVTLTTNDDTFAEGMTQPVMKDGTEEGKMRIFKQTSLIGTSIPTEAAEVVGLSTSMSAVIIGPRSADDVWVPAGEPSIEVTPTTLPMIEGQVGASNQVGTLHISARHLPGDVTIEVTGTNRSLFTTSVATISAGSSETSPMPWASTAPASSSTVRQHRSSRRASPSQPTPSTPPTPRPSRPTPCPSQPSRPRWAKRMSKHSP